MRTRPPDRTAAQRDTWPALPLADWLDTYETLHMWTQIVGKTRLACAPMVNHWWQVPLYVSARGLTTSRIPYGTRGFAVDFDFVAHELTIAGDDGARRSLALAPRSVADFHAEFITALRELELDIRILPRPVEVPNAIPFDDDETHRSYDPDAANRFWRALAQADRVLHEFRGRFIGKCSPVHFFWGSFDLACTRFSGRRAPPHPGGVPNIADWVVHEAYSHECISAGWWPGTSNGPVAEPAFYAYAYPEPAGAAESTVRPPAARYDRALREWVLPYDVVRSAPDPDAAALDFLQSTYETAADLGDWPRPELEREER
jgi:hypothetical protein